MASMDHDRSIRTLAYRLGRGFGFLPPRLATWLVAVTVGGLIAPPNLWAWGRNGHLIVAKIADLNLSNKAQTAIYGLLGQSIATDDNASWADDIKPGHRLAHVVGNRYPNNSKWHFVDIPFDADSYDAGRDCSNNDCIVDQLNRFLDKLADPSAKERDRREALLFVVHFVGDIHQPLHCAERNGDHGGNNVHVASYGEHHEHHLNLHAVWDDNLVYENENLRHLTPEDTAQRLNSSITSDQRRDWAQGSPQDWAWEAHRLAVDKAYIDGEGSALPADEVDLDQEYIQTRKAIVREQLQRAGIRLANALNNAFDN